MDRAGRAAPRLDAVAGEPYDTDRVLTVPNVLSMVRLLGVPLFLALLLDGRHDVAAVVVLALGGITDYLDGYLARRFNQRSRLGQMLDPAADRLYILATLLGLAVRGIVPWWLVGLLVARDVVLVGLVPVLKTRGFTSLPVHLLGKTATFLLLYAFPLVLLGEDASPPAVVARVVGWACLAWGTLLYWWAGLLYVRQTADILRRFPTREAA